LLLTALKIVCEFSFASSIDNGCNVFIMIMF
jgi:hypothetical protein